MILDLTLIHDLIHKDDTAINRLTELSEAETSVALSALTVFEIGVGCVERTYSIVNGSMRKSRIFTVVPLGESDARRAWGIQYVLLDRGERIGARDVPITGTALGSSDPRVLTRNVDKFERPQGCAECHARK